jgi:peptidoglycan/LPS O-acetylase OafA/YrhL
MLTGTRIIAAVCVFLFHANLQGFFASQDFSVRYSSVVDQGGWGSLTFFFVLSGFVLTWAVRPSDSTRSYYRRRIFKVYPNHIVTAVVGLCLVFFVTSQTPVADGYKPGPGAVVMNFLLVQSWSPDWLVRTSINPPAWSLSCELLFYAAFPLLYALVKRIRPERLLAWAAGVAAVAVIGVPVIAATVVPHSALIPGINLSLEQFWFIVHFPPTRGIEFVLGMVLARLVLSGWRPSMSLGGVVALVIAAYAVAPLFPPVFSKNAILLIPIALLIARMAIADTEKQRSWLSSKLMVRLGDLSFAFYLWHQLVLMYGDYWLGDTNVYSTPVGIAIVVGLFAVSLGLAYLLFTFVEAPIMRKWSGPRRTRPVLKTVVVARVEFKRAS